MKEKIQLTGGLCFDQRSERSISPRKKRDIRVDNQTFYALCDHADEGLYTRPIKYYGVVSRKDYPGDMERGKQGVNCIDNRYKNLFITRTDGFFHVYVLAPS